MTTQHYLGIGLVVLILLGLGIYSSKNVNNVNFSGNRSSNGFIVMGALIGTLVGGSSTIGTAQLAYNYGFSAWWFTLGGGIGVLVLGLLFEKPFYGVGLNTIPQLIEKEYGKKNADLVTVLNSLGTFLSVVAQVISATALITAVSGLNAEIAILISVLFIMIYVLFGGALSLGYAGTLKTILLSLSIAVCGILAFSLAGGLDSLRTALPENLYFSLFARGFSVDAGAGISLIVGVITTQSYISAITMASDNKEFRKGIISTAILVPLIGIAGIFVGMYMHIYYPDINSKMALPIFILDRIPPVVAGIMLGTLLLAVVGTAAGLSFGMAKMYYKNFFENKTRNEIFTIRTIITIVLILAGLLSYGDFGQYILNWSFLSMGLRGAVAFVPIITAMFLPGKIAPKFITMAICVGPLITTIGKFVFPSSIDSLIPGIVLVSMIVLFGYFYGKNRNEEI